MRIHFDNVAFGAHTGPNVFARRLAHALTQLGHLVFVGAVEGVDVSLVFIEPSGKPLAKKVVQRLDGFWFKPEDFATRNAGIRSLYQRADGVIFQSEFDKAFVTKFWDVPRTSVVINNGAAGLPVTRFTFPALEQLRNQYSKMFVCSSNWHPQKRLTSNIKLFQHIRATIEPDSCLVVLGDNPDTMVADKDIFYAGSQPHNVCDEVYSAANWMIHLAWLDHSPNVVCEAIAQGTPVICSEDGGTRELVKEYGIVLKEAKPFDLELTDYEAPPEIDVTQLTTLPQKHELTYHKLDIKDVAKRYVEFLERVVST